MPSEKIPEEIKDISKENDGPTTNRKLRIALIVGYNGINFSGSQKNIKNKYIFIGVMLNINVRTIEGEVEDCLFKMKLISKFNYGDLGKIAWSRATRTDKRVHALQNVFSCKI